MASFSLENDGQRIQCREFSDDPFNNASENMDNVLVTPGYLENVSDIIDDDFEIPSTQRNFYQQSK